MHLRPVLLAGALLLAGCGAAAPVPAAGGGRVLFELPDKSLRLVAATAHGSLVDVSARLGVTGPGALSRNGSWLVASTDDGCLVVSTGDFTKAEKVAAHGSCVAQYADTVDVSGDGALVVFNASGTHERDLYAVRRNGSGDWSEPVELTGKGPYAVNKLPRLSDDAGTVVYDCSNGEESDEGTGICEVGTGGGDVRTVLKQPLGDWTAFHSAAYRPDGGLVFECHHPGEELVCALPPGAHDPVRVTAAGTSNDNSPCVLPDGRIASLLDTGTHVLHVVGPTGGDPVTVYDAQDVLDAGISCGR